MVAKHRGGLVAPFHATTIFSQVSRPHIFFLRRTQAKILCTSCAYASLSSFLLLLWNVRFLPASSSFYVGWRVSGLVTHQTFSPGFKCRSKTGCLDGFERKSPTYRERCSFISLQDLFALLDMSKIQKYHRENKMLPPRATSYTRVTHSRNARGPQIVMF